MNKFNILNFKKKLNIFIIFLQLIRSRLRIGFNSSSELIAFFVVVNPIFNNLFYIWFKSIKKENIVSLKIVKKLIDKGIGYGAIRHFTPENRSKFNEIVLNTKPVNLKNLSNDVSKIIEKLISEGYTKLPIKLTDNELLHAQEYFGKCKFYKSQVYAQSNNKEYNLDWRNKNNFNSTSRNFCFKQIDTIRYLNDNSIIDLKYLRQIANLYCGFKTSLYEINTFGTFPGKSTSYVMRKHRDFDDFRFLTIFISWTKTTEEDGATLYAPGTHKSSKSYNEMIPLCAEAGEIFALDTFGFHAGNSRVLNPRLTSWIRYGNRINLATIQNGTSNAIGLLSFK